MEEYIKSKIIDGPRGKFSSAETNIGLFEVYRRKFNVKYEKVRSEMKKEIDTVINKIRDDEIMNIHKEFLSLMSLRGS